MDRYTFKGLVESARRGDASHPLSRWYEACAAAAGLKDWNTLSARLSHIAPPEAAALVARAAKQLGSAEVFDTSPVIVTNPHVHQSLKESRQAFLRRVAHIKYGRTNANYGHEEFLTTYIHSPGAYAAWSAARVMLRDGDFAHFDQRFGARHFAIAVPRRLAQWLLNNETDLLIRQMALWLAAKDAIEHKEEIMRDQLYPPYFDLVVSLRRSHFGTRDLRDMPDEEAENAYRAACQREYGSLAPEALRTPLALAYGCKPEWGVLAKGMDGEFDFAVTRLFLKESDWPYTVTGPAQDDMRRTESDDGTLWAAWAHQFATYDRNREHIYRPLTKQQAPRGFVYVVAQEGTDLYKIGFSAKSDVTMRVSSLQTGNANKLRLLGSFECAGRSTEGALHRRFGSQRASGEWFALSADDAAKILDAEWRSTENIF